MGQVLKACFLEMIMLFIKKEKMGQVLIDCFLEMIMVFINSDLPNNQTIHDKL